MGAEPSIRVMVVDTSPIVRAGMTAMLVEAAGIDVVAAADSPARAHQRFADLDVDVIVIHPGDGRNARWFEQLPDTRVVVLTDEVDELLRRAVSASSIDACLRLATVNDHDLASAVRGVMHGQTTIASEFLPELVQRRRKEDLVTRLTAREIDILELLTQGHTNETIAQELSLASGTVRIYVSCILAKLGTPNRTAAAVAAINEGLVDPAKGVEAEVD